MIVYQLYVGDQFFHHFNFRYISFIRIEHIDHDLHVSQQCFSFCYTYSPCNLGVSSMY